jgi:hypothetical protein
LLPPETIDGLAAFIAGKILSVLGLNSTSFRLEGE